MAGEMISFPSLPFCLRWLLAGLMICLQSTSVLAKISVIDTLSNQTAAWFSDQEARFGPEFPKDGLVGKLVYASPDKYACHPINAPPAVPNPTSVWIVLIARGGNCQFPDKVVNAQNANYTSAIVHNSKGDNQLIPMGGKNGSDVSIPSTFVGYDSGMFLKERFSYMDFDVKIKEQEEPDFRIYLWPFAIVVGVFFLMVMLFLIIKFVRDHTRARVARLSKKHLKKIPIRKYKKGQYYDTCAICLDEYEDGEKIRVLPCDHAYHSKCIDPWLTRNKKTCPVCKRRVIPGKDPCSGSESDSDGEITIQERTPLLSGSSTSTTSYGNRPTISSSREEAAPVTSHVGEQAEDGAVGGMGISDRVGRRSRGPTVERVTASVEESGEQREAREQKSKQRHAEVEEEETREERRERRRKKKEKRRQRADAAKRQPSGGSEESSQLLDSSENSAIVHSAEAGEEVVGQEGEPEDQNNTLDGYANAGFSDSSQTMVQPPVSRKNELNEVV